MINFPDLLTSIKGKKIECIDDWEGVRRQEILTLFKENIFGFTPEMDDVTFSLETEDTLMNGSAVRKLILVHYGKEDRKGSFRITLILPKDIKKVPAAVIGVNRLGECAEDEPQVISRSIPYEHIIKRGIAVAAFYFGEIDPDVDDGFVNGVHKVAGIDRKPDSWGTIAAWAWGYCRVMDYLVTDSDIDAKKVMAVGHSRGGKTALWAGAMDKRFYQVCSTNSGCTGAAISRLTKGEQVKDINTVFPYWFCENYKKYNNAPDLLPVDQHMLLSLIAPRKLYVASASEDSWADPQAEFVGFKEAIPIWDLYHGKSYGECSFPNIDEPIFLEGLAYHCRTGRHALMKYDWDKYIDFMLLD